MGPVLYFAYGSNMSSEQMGAWCRSPDPLGPAVLEGFRLAFLRDSPRWRAGAADIVAHRGHRVWGVLYRVGAADLAALDRKESSGGVLGYRRRAVRVRAGSPDDGGAATPPVGPALAAITYEVITRSRHELGPTAEYLELMVSGAREHGLPAEWVRWLQATADRLARQGPYHLR